MRAGAALVAPTATKPVHAAHAETAGESGNQRDKDCGSDRHDDEQGGAGEQRGCRSLQDGMNHRDECTKESHLG